MMRRITSNFSSPLVIVVLLLIVLIAAGIVSGVALAQSGDIPLIGKLQKGFHDPNSGLIDSWHVDYDSAVTPPTGARITGTVYSHLASLSRSGTTVTIGGTSNVPTSAGADEIFLFDQPGIITAAYYGTSSTANLQTARGDLFQYDGSRWVKVTGFDAIPDQGITEAMLDIRGNPSSGECIGWDGADLEWVICATGGAVTLTAGSVTTNILADNSVTEPKLDMLNTPSNDEVIVWDSANSAMEWEHPGTATLQDDSITEVKLKANNNPGSGQYLQWHVSTDLTWATVSAGLSTVSTNTAQLTGTGTSSTPLQIADSGVNTLQIASDAVTTAKILDGAVTEPKLAIHNQPVTGYYLEWDGNNGMTWVADPSTGGLTGVTTDSTLTGTGTASNRLSIADDAITTSKIATNAVHSSEIATDAVGSSEIAAGAVTEGELSDGAVAEPKLKIHNQPVDGYYLEWDSSNGMEWVINPSTGGITTVVTDSSLTGAGVTGNVLSIASDSISTVRVQDDAITGAKIADDAVDTHQIEDNAVTGAQINTGAVGTSELATDAVTSNKIATGAVTASDIADGAVTEPKLLISNTPQQRLLPGVVRRQHEVGGRPIYRRTPSRCN